MFTWEIMSSVFKNPNQVVTVWRSSSDCLTIQVIVAFPNLIMANQTVKKGQKAWKIQLFQFFILQNFEKILRVDLELWGCAIFGPRIAHLS